VRLLPLALLVAPFAYGDALSVGFRAGVPLTDALNTSGVFKSKPKRYTVGPSLELRLPMGIGFEFDALYRKMAYAAGGSETSASSWQFPLLFKYRLPAPVAHPFVTAGPVFHSLGEALNFGPDRGFALGGGLDIKLPKVHVSPEVRYTRWGGTKDRTPGVLFNKNQVDFLVGFTF
jgi:hypothetical protein